MLMCRGKQTQEDIWVTVTSGWVFVTACRLRSQGSLLELSVGGISLTCGCAASLTGRHEAVGDWC